MSSDGSYWKTATLKTSSTGDPNITLASTEYQVIDGFGGSFNEKGWEMLLKLSEAVRDEALRALFDAASGARFQYGRIPIGASDYARSRYTLAETPNDYEMKDFSIERDLEMLIPYVKAAVNIQPKLRLWASAWTPPPWMKTNNDYNGYPDAKMKSDAKILAAYALYLARFVEAYGEQGLKVEAVHVQNEPEELTNYPSCGWSPELELDFVKNHMGPVFQERSVTAEIWLGTLNKNNMAFPNTVLGDATARESIKGIGVQWDGLGMVSQLVSKYPSLPIMQTETNCGNNHWESGFNAERPGNDWAYGDFTWGRIFDYLKAGVRSYMAWNMVLDDEGKSIDSKRPWPQNSLLVIDSETYKLTRTPAYYAFRHFSAFVDVGAHRIGTSGSFSSALAFKNPDGRRVVVMRNSSAQSQTVTVKLGESVVSLDLPAHSWGTVEG